MGTNSTANYTSARARADFENGVYIAVIALRLGVVQSDVWARVAAEKWERPIELWDPRKRV